MHVSENVAPAHRILYLLPLALGLITLSILLRESSRQASTALFLLSKAEELEETLPSSPTPMFTVMPSLETRELIIQKANKGFIHIDHSDGIIKRKFWLDKGIKRIDLSRLPKGIYLVWATEWDQRQTHKIAVP